MITAPDSPLVHDIVPSGNIEERKRGLTPTILLMHYTGLPTAARAIEVLKDPRSKVSCHYVVDDAGRITQMVAESMRAWHAGLSRWHGEEDINSASIGIEIHNPGHNDGYPDFTEPQMQAVIALSQDIVSRHRIPPERILAHSDVAPTRKTDPGEKFDWRRLAAAGLGHWVEPEPVAKRDKGLGFGTSGPLVAEVQRLLKRYGYGVEEHGELDEVTGCVLRAFQLHFRPARVDGRIDQSTITTLERLLAALPAPLAS